MALFNLFLIFFDLLFFFISMYINVKTIRRRRRRKLTKVTDLVTFTSFFVQWIRSAQEVTTGVTVEGDLIAKI